MIITYYVLTFLLVITTFLPRINDQHWFFRIWDFGKVQLVIMQFLLLIWGFVYIEFDNLLLIICQGILAFTFIFNSAVLIRFTSLYKTYKQDKSVRKSKSVSLLSVNVYQFNDEYERLINLIERIKPDIVLTMESNYNWDMALEKLDSSYKHSKKIPQENTYGMHFWTNLEVKKIKVNHFMSDDIPSIHCSLKTEDGWDFDFIGIHPPPPSPTEEETSKERDGELLSVAKIVKDMDTPVVVAGDFNNVAWAKSSMLFKRISQLIDPRVGRGFVSTFHAKYWFLRFPIDLFFHSEKVYIEEFKAEEAVGSDHFPLYTKFHIGSSDNPETVNVEKQEEDDTEEMEEMIDEGKHTQSERKEVVTED
ncbi:Uncharacterized conserved protein YafD, endonuclease/exonuclease/phosphatase (EEP) superfamily [Flavobacteriaceae bacterium MAR_2010_188]|nr:Uncharacterized conserved protein YafD, endonuclease/exonuclease/phosphatase (EEP) superfamily [Flavobacteriaceae bacterium MAR_2010_188]